MSVSDRLSMPLPLSSLKRDPVNVRKTDIDPTPQFISSVREHGILEPLTVRENGDGYLVTNGGKRLAVLQALVKEGKLEPGTEVPCIVLRAADDRTARDVSLAVNYMRETMHPVDEYEAFAQLLDDGLPREDIGKRYGLKKREVDQVLALGQLAPEVRQAWRKGDIDEDAAQEFTLEPDQKEQAKILAAMRRHHGLNAWQIRGAIIGEARQARGLLNFVGLEAYKAAGGVLRQDLFSEEKGADAIATDVALLKKLAEAKLTERIAELKAEGWKWVSLAADLPSSHYMWDSRAKNSIKVDDRSKYGVILTREYDGNITIKYGVQKPAERERAEKAAGTKKDQQGPAISAALSGRLSSAITLAAATVLETNAQLALAALAASLSGHDGPVCISQNGGNDRRLEDDHEDRDFADRFSQLAKKSVPDLAKIIAKIVAGALAEADETKLRRCIAEAEVQFLLPPEPINDNLTDSDWSAGNGVVRGAMNSAETGV